MINPRDILTGTLVIVVLFGLMFFLVAPVRAQHAPTFRSEYKPRHIYIEHRHRRHTRKVWRHDSIEIEDGCKDYLATVGDQYASEDGAKQEADKAWMQTARWQYGERFMSRENADDATYECGRSSVGSVAGQIFIRCRLTARPCRPERQDAK